MEKLNAKFQVSLKNVINNTYLDEEKGWIEMPEITRFELGNKFKEFLLSKCRKNSSVYTNIERVVVSECESFGIFERLIYNFETDKVEYIAGQSYPEEIATLKKLFLK